MVTNRQIGVRFLFFILTKFGDSGWGVIYFSELFFYKINCYFHPTFSQNMCTHCVLFFHPLVLNCFFMLWLFHLKKNAEGEEIFTSYHFVQIFDHTYHFFRSSTTFYHPTNTPYRFPPYFVTLPLSWTPLQLSMTP